MISAMYLYKCLESIAGVKVCLFRFPARPSYMLYWRISGVLVNFVFIYCCYSVSILHCFLCKFGTYSCCNIGSYFLQMKWCLLGWALELLAEVNSPNLCVFKTTDFRSFPLVPLSFCLIDCEEKETLTNETQHNVIFYLERNVFLWSLL